ncbi:archaellin/type IV pilin N-terminal domain-containing protein [Nitrosopumilus ureiphilus]|uniref:Flagellin n=1 Tax=Nitrosopumilus ureiphilus TaxID=1470067 RepID=A0A7D5M4E8_9ARCH|nr:archaellin/type IV pilin N-terminal domain-containing protein [Nitrosopumilus ureiphilus]QLH06886.1 flagellin [Nitrosopumilus ureiphilus]
MTNYNVNLEKKEVHRGIIGVETALIMIASVMISAALLYVVFNTGFSTVQKTKNFISAGVIESRSSLAISGALVGVASVGENKLNVTAIPIKVAISGGESINLNTENAAVRYINQDIEHGDIYTHTIVDGIYSNLQDAMQKAVSDGLLQKNPINQTAATENTQAILFFTINRNNNFLIDSGEHAFMVIIFKDFERPSSLETIVTEIVLSTGTTLTVERTIPNLTSKIVDFS